MKLVLAALSGFALTTAIFGGGVAFALVYLSAEPVSLHQVQADGGFDYHSEVRVIDVTSENPQSVTSEPVAARNDAGRSVVGRIDDIATSSVSNSSIALQDQHRVWCKNRYRSYESDTNTYRPYRGGRRECISPYLGGAATANLRGDERETRLAETAYIATAVADPNHIENCSRRYRSYRADDNSYQPYGGGPRATCSLSW